MGTFSPLGAYVVRRFGHVAALAIAQCCLVLFFFLLSTDGIHSLTYPAMICGGLAGGFINPFLDIRQALYVKESHRGRQMSTDLLFKSLGSVAGALLAAFRLVSGTYWPLGLAGVGLCFVVVACASVLPDKVRASPSEAHARIIARQLRDAAAHPRKYLLPAFFGEQFVYIMSAVFVPAYLFMAVGDFQTFGFLVAGALVLEVAVMAGLGHAIDHGGFLSKFRTAYGAYLAANAYLLMQVTSPFTAFVGASGMRLAQGMYVTRFATMIHGRISHLVHADMLLFGMVWQMSLCIWLLTLGVLAGVAWWLSLETFVPFIILSTAGAGIAMLPVWRKKD